MASINVFKKKSGKEYLAVQWMDHRVRKQKYIGANNPENQAKAESFIKGLKEQVNESLSADLTVKESISLYLKELNRISPSTQNRIEGALTKVEQELGDERVRDVTADDLKKLVSDYSPLTARKYLLHYSKFFWFLFFNKLVYENVLRGFMSSEKFCQILPNDAENIKKYHLTLKRKVRK